MKSQKSIGANSTLLQRQLLELLAEPQLIGRIILGLTEDFEWQQLKCLVPLYSPSNSLNEWTTIKAVARLNCQNPERTPGLYIESAFLTPQSKFINLTEDHSWPETQLSLRQVLGRLISQIDALGFLEWARKTYLAHIPNNKMTLKQVNQKSAKKCNINDISGQKNIIKINNSTKLEQPFDEKLSKVVFDQDTIRPHRSSAFSFMNNQMSQIKLKNQQSLQNVKLKDTHESDQNHEQVAKIVAAKDADGNLETDKTNEDENNCHKQLNINVNQKSQNFEANSIFRSPFSCFKPLSQQSSLTLPKNKKNQEPSIAKIYEKNEKFSQDFFKLRSSSFVPYNLATKEKGSEKASNLNLEKVQNSSNAKVESVSQQEGGHQMTNEVNQKGVKHPKPMNKNANLPKFLIRIFIKYVDKFKSMYVKRQYDRLYSQCKKMKEWKKNDRRQHAFGLKHLKIFFQDAIDGFPDPALNRKVISKIIDNFLLEQICQNSQIPQSHRSIFDSVQKCLFSWTHTVEMIGSQNLKKELLQNVIVELFFEQFAYYLIIFNLIKICEQQSHGLIGKGILFGCPHFGVKKLKSLNKYLQSFQQSLEIMI